jgi:hypothetical protein
MQRSQENESQSQRRRNLGRSVDAVFDAGGNTVLIFRWPRCNYCEHRD